MANLFLDTGATFGGPNDCYRYRLWRRWNPELSHVCWVMLNPSTADHTQNDPTIRRCMDFTDAWGYGGLVVVNLFALRATDPAALRRHPDPVGGPENDTAILEEASRASVVIAAWGEHGRWQRRNAVVIALLAGVTVHCLGRTLAGNPKHPLYLNGSTTPELFSIGEK